MSAHGVDGGRRVTSWADFTPKEAAEQKLNLAVRTDIAAPVNEQGERCPWPWEPQQFVGAPLGMYHCGYCGAMVVAGIPHVDYSPCRLRRQSMSEGATIAADDGMDWGFVHVDEHAPDYETARRVLRERAVIDWGLALGSIEDSHPQRRSYRCDEGGEDELVACEPDDPRRDSDWWVFDLSLNDHSERS